MAFMISHDKLLASADEISEMTARLRQHSIIAFDTEFIREKTFYPQLEIVQVATDEESWLIDAQAFRGSSAKESAAMLSPLIEVFQDPNILKTAHAAEGDQECLYTQFGIVAAPIMDTAVAASLCGYGENMGLAALLKAVLDITIKKGYSRTHWSERPLPPQLAEYAHADVAHLVCLARQLLIELEKLDRKDWALEISEKSGDIRLFNPDPEGMAHRLARGGRVKAKNFPVLLELIRWRENKIRELNIPRRWLADDNVLMSLAEIRPKNEKIMKSFRGLNQRALKDSGQEIFEAIERGEKHTDIKMPRFDKPRSPSTQEARAVNLIKCYIEYLASQHNIAAKQLIDPKVIIKLLRHRPRDPEGWVEQELISPFAAELIGRELVELMNGNRALTIKNNHISVLTEQEDTA